MSASLAPGFLFLTLFSQAALAGSDTILHRFAGPDGYGPGATLIEGTDGNLYGTTEQGGTVDRGTVFQLSQAETGAYTVLTSLHTFSAEDGYNPYAGLIQATDGNLYGTTTWGGSGGAGSGGTVFELSSDESGAYTVFTVLHSFIGSYAQPGTGYRPFGGLIQASDGNLYGTNAYGGEFNFGAVFELSPDESGAYTVFTVLHAFTGGDGGSAPDAKLMQASDGNLYGAADNTVFELSPDENGAFTVFTVLYVFTGPDGQWRDGRWPKGGLIQASDGNLYGMTEYGGDGIGGTAFELSPDDGGAYTVFTRLHSFNQLGDGYNSRGGLIQASDGNLYGTAFTGGSGGGSCHPYCGGQGTVFELSPDSDGSYTVFTLLHFFIGNQPPSFTGDGSAPLAGLMQASDGNLYGTTYFGGNQGMYDSGLGTVFNIGVASASSGARR